MVDPKCYGSKTSTLENPISSLASEGEACGFLKNTNKLFGVSPSDIDKYSRVVFLCVLSVSISCTGSSTYISAMFWMKALCHWVVNDPSSG
ncbi:hypothetical protein CEXT_481381 [Caerostris extrusa]|uniref:Uncharacterized protein n=1 Tax=Caerostris extrusa TaxID=172846 RepID=A0AAV4RA17_CAEEX|nr:hypothetical protein CEXT_481381 [Caerostris extrusa]